VGIIKITHLFNKKNVDCESDSPIFVLSNKKGNYFSISNNQTSYQGFCVERNGSMYKLIDSINFLEQPFKVMNSSNKLIFHNKKSLYKFIFKNTLICDINNYHEEIYLDLDFRDLYDYPKFGRKFNFNIKDNIVIVEYKKYSNDDLNCLEDTFYLAVFIKGLDKNSLNITDNWISKEYSIDKKRNYDFKRYINRAISFRFEKGFGKIFFSYGNSECECIERLKFYSGDFDFVNEHCHDFDFNIKLPFYQNEISTTAHSLDINIHSLLLNNNHIKNIFAGWPWFFQFWTRDTLISLGSLILMEKFDNVKDILDNYLSLVNKKGLINSRIPNSELKSIDSTGWLFKRYYDFLYSLSEKKLLQEYYTFSSLKLLKHKLELIFDSFIGYNMKNGFIYSGKNETWMDTNYSDNGRVGYCIEIQALTLSMIKTLRLINLLLNSEVPKRYIHIESDLIKKIRNDFLDNNLLADTIFEDKKDFTIRPNIFLTRYVYPHLFSNAEWKEIFSKALDKLFLNWGGLSSIDKTNSNFISEHTGSDNKSYHRGDSWYFLNNIAAIQLLLVDKKEFSIKAKIILEASLKDLKSLGAVGCCSEISSAKSQTAEGCLNQSWSSATLIELIYLFNDKKGFLS